MSIHIKFATDFVCPYCYAAEIPLLQALVGREDVEVELLPLELTPTSKEPVDTYHDENRRAKWAADLVPFCKELGLSGHFPPKVIPRPYTHLAWQGYHYACDLGKGGAYAEAMYRAYFEDEQDIGDLDVLCTIAARLGLDEAEFRRMVAFGVYSDYQDNAVAETRALGVSAVPTIWIGGMRLDGDLYTKEDFALLLDQVSGGEASEKSDTSQTYTDGGFGCGPDGC